MYIICHGYVPGDVWLQVIRDGIPQLVSTVYLTGWYVNAARTISYFLVFSHRDAYCYSPFCDHGQDLREVNSYENIIIVDRIGNGIGVGVGIVVLLSIGIGIGIVIGTDIVASSGRN